MTRRVWLVWWPDDQTLDHINARLKRDDDAATMAVGAPEDARGLLGIPLPLYFIALASCLCPCPASKSAVVSVLRAVRRPQA